MGWKQNVKDSYAELEAANKRAENARTVAEHAKADAAAGQAAKNFYGSLVGKGRK